MGAQQSTPAAADGAAEEPTSVPEEVRSEAWAGAQRFRCALTTVGALLQQRCITDVDLLKVCIAGEPTQRIRRISARRADHFVQ